MFDRAEKVLAGDTKVYLQGSKVYVVGTQDEIRRHVKQLQLDNPAVHRRLGLQSVTVRRKDGYVVYHECLLREHNPPLGAEKLLSFFLPVDRLEETLGDLEEQFPKLVHRYKSVRFARIVYWWAALRIAALGGLKLAGVVTAIWKAFSTLR